MKEGGDIPKTTSYHRSSHKCLSSSATSVQRHDPSAIGKHLGSTRSAVEVKILHKQTNVNSSIEMAQRRRHTEDKTLFFFHINEHGKKKKKSPKTRPVDDFFIAARFPSFFRYLFFKHPLTKKKKKKLRFSVHHLRGAVFKSLFWQ